MLTLSQNYTFFSWRSRHYFASPSFVVAIDVACSTAAMFRIVTLLRKQQNCDSLYLCHGGSSFSSKTLFSTFNELVKIDMVAHFRVLTNFYIRYAVGKTLKTAVDDDDDAIDDDGEALQLIFNTC